MDFSNVQWLDLVNRSLAMISSSMLSKLDEGTSESNYAAVLLPQAVEEVYGSLPLDDISIYSQLPRLADNRQVGSAYQYAYKLPASCASVREVITDGTYDEWQLVKGAILTNSSEVTVRYIPLPSTPDDIPFYARDLISLLLASRLAGPISHNEALANIMAGRHDTLYSKALTLSGQQQNQPDYANTSKWTEDRQ